MLRGRVGFHISKPFKALINSRLSVFLGAEMKIHAFKVSSTTALQIDDLLTKIYALDLEKRLRLGV